MDPSANPKMKFNSIFDTIKIGPDFDISVNPILLGQERAQIIVADVLRSGVFGTINHKVQIDHFRRINGLQASAH